MAVSDTENAGARSEEDLSKCRRKHEKEQGDIHILELQMFVALPRWQVAFQAPA